MVCVYIASPLYYIEHEHTRRCFLRIVEKLFKKSKSSILYKAGHCVDFFRT